MSALSCWDEYVVDTERHANEIVECPACGDVWYRDLDEDGNAYTCFYCCNGTIRIRRWQVEEDVMRALREGQE